MDTKRQLAFSPGLYVTGTGGQILHLAESATDDVQKEGTPGTMVEREREAEPVTAHEARRKVLIVEDAMELAEVIAATLDRINIQTFHETHVERALAAYYARYPDLILLDIGLPDKTGWKLLDEIKEQDASQQPIVIVITAHGDPANRLMGKLQGVYGYLIKPFTPDEVEDVVTRAFRGKPSQYNAGVDIDVSRLDAEGFDSNSPSREGPEARASQ